jgi:tetratricopeptide (TPR) repeat protein
MTRHGPSGRRRNAPPIPSAVAPAIPPARRDLSLPILFALALAIRLVHVVAVERSPFGSVLMGDALSYDSWAQQIAGGDWVGREVFYQAPLYPYLVGLLYRLVGHSLLAVRVLQAAMSASACVLAAVAGRRLFGRAAGLGAGVVLALYAPAVFFDGLVQKAALDLLLCAVLLWLVARAQERPDPARCLLTGLALGAFALSRENALLLLPVLLAWSWWRSRRGLVQPLALFLGTALALAPVALRNHAVGRQLVITTAQLGPNLYIGNSETANGVYVPLRPGRGNAAVERQDATELAEAAAGRKLTASEVSGYWRGRAWRWMTAHPGRWLSLLGKKLLLVCNRTEVVDTEDLESHAEWSPVLKLLSLVGHFGVLAPLAALGLWRTRERWRELWVLPVTAALYGLGVAMFFVLGRYRYPLVPFLALYAGAGLAGLAAWWRGLPPRRRWEPALFVAGAAVLCNLPLVSSRPMEALTQTNLGIALEQEGRAADAEARYRDAIRLSPRNADALSNLGALVAARGGHREALDLLRRAIEVDPEHAQAHTNLGLTLAALGRAEEALAAFRRAVALDPRDAVACYNLGTALAQAGDTESAIRWLRAALVEERHNPAAHNNLGILLVSSGRLREGIAEFRAALELQPSFTEASANLERALAMARAGEAPDARAPKSRFG